MRTIQKPQKDEMNMMGMPSFSLSQTQLPDIKSWNVGKKYKMEIEVEMVGSNKDEYSDKSELSARFKITKVGVEKENPAKKGYK